MAPECNSPLRIQFTMDLRQLPLPTFHKGLTPENLNLTRFAIFLHLHLIQNIATTSLSPDSEQHLIGKLTALIMPSWQYKQPGFRMHTHHRIGF